MTEERIRLIIDTDYKRRQAVRFRAVKTGQTVSDVINALIDQQLADEIREVEGTPRAHPASGKKKGRKPKPPPPA